MNLFVIPSWYPSASNPSYGIFIQEQLLFMATERPDWNIGVSKWGQGAIEKSLWASQPFQNIKKINKHWRDHTGMQERKGISEYYSPALTWTKRFLKGNLKGIIQANKQNVKQYIEKFGKPDVISVLSSVKNLY